LEKCGQYLNCFVVYAGSFVVVDESGKEKALESGSKVACIVSQVLFYEHVRVLQRSPEWSLFFTTYC
jgi:probable RNA-binding protein EIF1AD